MMHLKGWLSVLGHSSADWSMNEGDVPYQQSFDINNDIVIGPGADIGAGYSLLFQSAAGSAPGQSQPGSPVVSSPASQADSPAVAMNAGMAGFSALSSVAPAADSVSPMPSASTFTGGTATATSASDLNALITAADQQVSAGTLTINISGSIALNTLPAVANGETLTIVANQGTVTKITAVPDIAAINLHSGVSLVFNGSGGATLDGGNTVRGLFAYTGNVTLNNLTIQNTVAQGGSGANAGFAGGGGAGLGGGLFVGAHARRVIETRRNTSSTV